MIVFGFKRPLGVFILLKVFLACESSNGVLYGRSVPYDIAEYVAMCMCLDKQTPTYAYLDMKI